MAGKINYFYKNECPNADISKWLVSSGTSCRLIGQPTVTWDNLGSLFFKHNDYGRIIQRLLEPNQHLYNVIQFCENNPNCVEIEIDKRKCGSCYSGHHIFASSFVDLTEFIDSHPVPGRSAHKNVTVTWICNYGQEQEAPLDQFLTMIRDLETDPQKCGITYKEKWSLSDTYEEHKHLSFILDLRRYCGDVSRFSQDFDKFVSKEQYIVYVDQFHKKYVEPNTPPPQQIAWTFLQNLKRRNLDCHYINKNLQWNNVKKWDTKLGLLISLFNQELPEFVYHIPETPSTSVIKSAIDQFQQFNANKCNQSATTLLVETLTEQIEATIHQFKAFLAKKHSFQNAKNLVDKLKATESSFAPSLNANENVQPDENMGSIVSLFKAFLERKHLVQNAGKLIQQIKSAPIDDSVIFAIYRQLFKRQMIKELKDPDSKAINILSFLTQNVQKNGIVASISVPDSGGKKLILVVNNLGDVKEDELKQLLFDLVKRKALPVPFVNSRFSLFFDNKIHADLSSLEAFNLFKTILPDENVDRIDGIVVTEQAVRETAAETWTEGVTAGIKFLMLSHMFLTHYYDNQFFQNVLKSYSNKQVKELIQESTEKLGDLQKTVDQSASVKDLQLKIERLTPNLFQLSTHLEYILPIMPEGVELHSVALKDLNLVLSSIIESEKLPKKSSN